MTKQELANLMTAKAAEVGKTDPIMLCDFLLDQLLAWIPAHDEHAENCACPCCEYTALVETQRQDEIARLQARLAELG